MTDTNALRSIIADSGLKYKAIAEIMGLTPYALQMKIDNETEFKASEIDTLANTLGMDMQQRDSIFFLQEKWNLITLLQVHPKEVKKMKNNIQKEIQERREHAERLKKIALKLFEQLKSENVSFSDAERIISLLSASVKTERDDRII